MMIMGILIGYLSVKLYLTGVKVLIFYKRADPGYDTRMLISFFLMVFTSMAFGRELCFPSQNLAAEYTMKWNARARALTLKLLAAKRVSLPTHVFESKNCDACVVIEGDSYIRGIFEEEFNEKEKEFTKMREEAPSKLKVDVSLTSSIPIRRWEIRFFSTSSINHFSAFRELLKTSFMTWIKSRLMFLPG